MIYQNIQKQYKGKMYKLTSQLVDIDCTIDHRLYIKKRRRNNFELLPAEDVIGKRVKHKKDCDNNNPDIEYYQLTNERKVKMDDLLDLLGIFIADGYAEDGRIRLSGGKERKIKHIMDVCEKLQIKLILDKSKSGIEKSKHLNTLGLGMNHSIYDKELYDFFKPLSVGALNKFLPDFVWNVSQRQSKILLDSLVSCDGHVKKQTGSECYYTSSKQLADDVMKLAIHSGISGRIDIVRKKGTKYDIKCKKSHLKGTSNADALAVMLNYSKNTPTMNHGHTKQQNGQKEELYDYDGMVYCFEVPSHVFMSRLNGKNVWIGNCCFSEDHEVLTENGWTPIKEITTEHKVAALKKDEKTLYYTNPVATQKFKYTGKI